MIPKIVSLLFMFIAACFIDLSSCDPVEGSRLLEEAFRDYDRRIRPSFGGSPVFVNVSLHILSVSEIDTARMRYTMTFFIRQMWIDPRLSFNSRRNIDTIMLDGQTSERLWIPDTFFVNELSSVNHEMLVKNQFCRMSQDGSILLSRRVTLTAFSPMDVSLFPYDAQELSLEIESYGSQSKDLKYQWQKESEDAVSSSVTSVPGFQINIISASELTKTTETGSYSRLIITISTRRNPLSYELGLMIPALLLVVLCFATLRIKKSSNAFIINVLSISSLLILYGQVSLQYSKTNGGIPFFSPLQIYIYISSIFSFICLFVNMTVKKSIDGSLDKAAEPGESKSRTESTSEDCKLEELKCDAVVSSLDNPKKSKLNEGEGKLWKKLKCDGFIEALLWMLFVSTNIAFFVVFRCLR